MREQIAGIIQELHPKLVEMRRDFHRHPELGFEEFRTSAIAADWLTKLGLEVRTGVAVTGIVARLRGGKPGKTIALRADMDALPIQDIKSCDYKSTVEGKMHACGHDAHTTMVLGAAAVLSQIREHLAGDVVFLLQPAEEGLGGAARMIEEGALDGVDFILAQHVVPMVPAGIVAVTDGPTSAAADEFALKIHGHGGHAAYPHTTVDAVQIAAQVVTALQAIVSRSVDPFQAAVLTIGTINGGYNTNIVADCVTMTGTVRTYDKLLREDIPRRIESITKGITEGYGARYELDYQFKYPPTFNHKEAVELVMRVAKDLYGPQRFLEAPPTMAGEDFAFFTEKIPGAIYWLGAKHPQPEQENYNLHHPAFDIDEKALFIGVQMLVEASLAYLNETAKELQEA